jgi:hypothetical protein
MLKMASTENPRTDAGGESAAIARWDDEGGASKSAPRKKGADVLKKRRRSGRVTDNKHENAHATHPIGRRRRPS